MEGPDKLERVQVQVARGRSVTGSDGKTHKAGANLELGQEDADDLYEAGFVIYPDDPPSQVRVVSTAQGGKRVQATASRASVLSKSDGQATSSAAGAARTGRGRRAEVSEKTAE